jgi:hypothetical protein
MITNISASIDLSALRISQDYLEQGGGSEKNHHDHPGEKTRTTSVRACSS